MTAFDSSAYFSTRGSARADFVAKHFVGAGSLAPVGDDWSLRRFYRVARGNDSAVLIESVPDDHPAAPMGHKIADYIDIGARLRHAGISVPQVIAVDEAEGFLLVEDFGSVTFRDVLDRKLMPSQTLYNLATDLLVSLRDTGISCDGLPDYYQSHVHRGRCRLVDWYLPLVRGRMNEPGLTQSFLAMWDGIEKTLPAPVQGFQHVDFHLQNLLWLPDRDGMAQCGLIDFQGGMKGPVGYDLCNLLDDIRIDVPQDIRAACRKRFGDDAWYDVLAAQFHCRIVGQVYKLAIVAGKTRLIQYMPIVTAHLARDIEKPVLAPLKTWLRDQGLAAFPVPDFDPARAPSLIAPDAF